MNFALRHVLLFYHVMSVPQMLDIYILQQTMVNELRDINNFIGV